VRAEFYDGVWGFTCRGNPQGRVRFDQALIDATFVGNGVVEGYVKSVHGADMDLVKYLGTNVKIDLGITGPKNLAPQSYRRVRLMPDGLVERMVDGL
jgi:hypothetical protein